VTPRRWRVLVFVLLVFAGVLLTTAFGDHLLVATDALPHRADAAVVMAGSREANIARLDGAVQLLRQGRVDYVVYRVDPLAVWGEWLPEAVRRFIQREYGDLIASKIILCEGFSDSTVEGVRLINYCLRDRGFRSIIVVTSDYHTRRTRMVWKAEIARKPAEVSLAVFGVPDGSFEVQGWWRNRRYAKTWFLETTKLGWYMIESLAPSSP